MEREIKATGLKISQIKGRERESEREMAGRKRKNGIFQRGEDRIRTEV